MGYHLEDIAAGRFVDSSGSGHDMIEIKLGGKVIWPRGVITYVVDNFAFAYSAGLYLYVDKSNYAVITARQRKYIDGVLDETTTVTMTPVRISGTNRYTIASDGKIWFDIDSYGTTEFSQSTAQFKGAYSIGGQTYETGSYTLTLEGNSKETIIESASISLALRSSTVACTATSADVKPAFSATYHYHYTSGRDSATTTGAIGSVSLYRDGTYIKDTTTSGSFTDIGISTNYNTESMKSYAISAVYQNGGVVLDSDSITQYQSGDEKGTITDTPISGSYFITKGAQQGTIDATGGTNVRIPLSAGHKEHRTQYWVHGGGTIIDREIDVTDSVSGNYTISGTTDAKSRYYDISLSSNIFHISHYNMGERGESADDITVTFYNGSDSSATTSASFQPRNTYYPAHYGNTVGITIGLNHDYLECTGGTVEVSGTRQRGWYADGWASGAGGVMTYKYESITSWTSITVSPSATVAGTIITIPSRIHNTSSQVFTVTGTADGKSATATIERLGDSTYTGTQYTRNHYLQVEGAGNTISAQGGSRRYDISAGHTLVTPTYWRSDDALYSESTTSVTDKWKYTKSGGGQSYYRNFNVAVNTESSADHLSFDHDNMAKREETDTLNISIVSAFDSTKTFAETLAPVNRLEVDDPETTTAFAINSVSKVTSSGTTIQIAGTRTYKTAYKKWTSNAEEGGETRTESDRNADSIQIVDATTHTWAHADTGGKLRIDANTTSETDRSVQFWAVCGDYTAKNGSATQWRNDYYTYTYSVDRFGLRSTSLEWDETASTEVLLTVYRTSTLHHDGGSTVIGTTTSPDDLTISLTGNTTHFTLFNNTRGTRGTSIAAKSGESLYVEVVGRNDGQTDLVTTVNNSISDDKDTLTHKHRVDPADAVTIENKSSYNLMIRWEERSSSEITIPAGETGYLLSRRYERIEFKVASGTANITVKNSGDVIGSGTVTTDWTNIGVEGSELSGWSMRIENT